jgi:hypothetical protein
MVKGKPWWYWLGYAFGAFYFLNIALGAFSTPWAWTSDQLLFAVLCSVWIAVLAVWGTIWARGGTEAVKERWALMQKQSPRSKKSFLISLIFWIVVAVALVVYFNVTSP